MPWLDAYARRVVGWAMANRLHTELVLNALNMPLRQRRLKQVIRRSNQGHYYTSSAFGPSADAAETQGTALHGFCRKLRRGV